MSVTRRLLSPVDWDGEGEAGCFVQSEIVDAPARGASREIIGRDGEDFAFYWGQVDGAIAEVVRAVEVHGCGPLSKEVIEAFGRVERLKDIVDAHYAAVRVCDEFAECAVAIALCEVRHVEICLVKIKKLIFQWVRPVLAASERKFSVAAAVVSLYPQASSAYSEHPSSSHLASSGSAFQWIRC